MYACHAGMDNNGALVFMGPSSNGSGSCAGTSSLRIRLAWRESRELNETTMEAVEEVGVEIVWRHRSALRSGTTYGLIRPAGYTAWGIAERFLYTSRR
jgi:hypothetical protein